MVCADTVPARYVLCIMLFLGFMTTFLLRANLNVAIVAMVKPTATAAESRDQADASVAADCAQTNFTDTDARCYRNMSDLEATGAFAASNASTASTGTGEFEWSEMQQSVILGSFFWGYLIFQVPGGRIAETHGTKIVYGLALFINSILCFLLPFAAKTHWTLLLLIRALQGLAQGVVFPALNATVVRWVPLAERARFVSFALQGGSLGVVVAQPLCGWVLTSWGWEAVFFVSGAITLVWTVAWWLLMFDTPSQHPRLGPRERAYLEEKLKPVAGADDEKRMRIPWGAMARSRQIWLGVIAGIGSDWGFHTFFTLGPKYMKNALGFDVEKSSWLSSVPYLSQYVFAMLYGTVADQMTERRVTLSVVRRISVAISHLIPCVGLLLLSGIGCHATLSVVVLTFCVTMFGAITSGFFQMPTDIAPNFAGFLTGVMNGLGSATAVVSTPLAGALLQFNGPQLGWRYIFWVSAGMYLLGGLPYVIYYRGEIEPWNEPEPGTPSKTKEVSLEEISAPRHIDIQEDKKR